MIISAGTTATWVARGLAFTILVAMVASVALLSYVGDDTDELATQARMLQLQQGNAAEQMIIEFEDVEDVDNLEDDKDQNLRFERVKSKNDDGEDEEDDDDDDDDDNDDENEDNKADAGGKNDQIIEGDDAPLDEEEAEEEDKEEEEKEEDEEEAVNEDDDDEEEDDVEYDENEDFDEYMDEDGVASEDNADKDDEDEEFLKSEIDDDEKVEIITNSPSKSLGNTPRPLQPEVPRPPLPIQTNSPASPQATATNTQTNGAKLLASDNVSSNGEPPANIYQKQPGAPVLVAAGPPALRRRLPDCLIIGVRKGGTRALMHFLLMNKRVATLGPELGFFINEERYALGLDWYRDQMPPVHDDQVLIEKSADYFQYSMAPERVYNMNSSIKIVLVVRDPISRMISDYHFIRRYAQMNNITDYYFKEVDHTLEDLLINSTTGELKFDHGGLYRSRYSKFLKNWYQWFPKDQIHIVDGDRFSKENPAIELMKMERFLGLQPVMTEDKFYYSDDKGFWCLRETGCLGSEKGHKFADLDPKVHTLVKNYFRGYNYEFYRLTNTRFSWND